MLCIVTYVTIAYADVSSYAIFRHYYNYDSNIMNKQSSTTTTPAIHSYKLLGPNGICTL